MRSNPLVWTWVVRLSHWLVAGLVCVEWVNETGYWHRVFGYLCTSVVMMRVVNGLLSRHVNSQFYWPSYLQISQHLYALKASSISPHSGHNPLGQLAIYAMWSLIALLCISGWLSQTDAFWGKAWPINLHALFAYSLMGLVSVHLVAVMMMSRLSKRNLVKQMVVGQ